MKLRAAFTSCLALVLLGALPAAHAEGKKVRFNLRNNTGARLELKLGDAAATLQPGQVMPVKLAYGTRIVTSAATETHKAGELIVTVGDNLPQNSTLSINK